MLEKDVLVSDYHKLSKYFTPLLRKTKGEIEGKT